MSKIPTKKHSKAELSRIKAQSAMQNDNSVANTYNKQLASKFTIILGYVLPLITIIWWAIKLQKTKNSSVEFEMSDFYIMTIPIVLALLLAAWIALKRVLSRHNSAFITILCILCCFPIASAINSSEFLKADLFSLVGKEYSVYKDPLIEAEEENSTSINTGMSDAERKELLEYEEKLKLENAEYLRNKAREDAIKEATEGLGS